jgi:hypothetical protein
MRVVSMMVLVAAGCAGPAGPIGTMGDPGAMGAMGASVTASVEPSGANCASGGVALKSDGGALYVCNGPPGTIDPNRAILNGTALQTASFNISGNGLIGGKLGIGTATPQTALDLVGDFHSSTGNFQRPDNAGVAFQVTNGVNTSYGDFRANDAIGSVTNLIVESTGFVGIGTSAPAGQLHVVPALALDPATAAPIILGNNSGVLANSNFNVAGTKITIKAPSYTNGYNGHGAADVLISGGDISSAAGNTGVITAGSVSITGGTAGGARVNAAGNVILNASNGGNVGIGTAAPDSTLTVNGAADKPGGGAWNTFSDGRLKDIRGPYDAGLKEVLALRPIRYRYKNGNPLGLPAREEYVGLVAQDVERVIPRAVSKSSNGYRVLNNDPVIWAMLNAIQEQEQQIERLRGEVRALRRGQ